jgi:hypothetical protein
LRLVEKNRRSRALIALAASFSWFGPVNGCRAVPESQTAVAL